MKSPQFPVSLLTAKQVALSVREIDVADADGVHAIESAAHSHPMSRSLVDAVFNRYWCLGLLFEQQLIGFAMVSVVAGEAELIDYVVAPNFQGKGIGSCFLEWLITAVTPKAERFFLEVRESNQAAIALYQNAGFAEVGVRHNYYPAKRGREDAVLMALELLAPE